MSSSFALVVSDDLGEQIQLQQPAMRIISLAPDLTEILFAIGAGDRVIAVVQGSDYPAAARRLPVVGAYNGLDLERVLALHPDLIVMWGSSFARQVSVFKKLGIPIYQTQPEALVDVARTMRHLGYLVGKNAEADHVASGFLQRLLTLKKKYGRRKTITVFYQIGTTSLFTINKKSWINQAITLCGGQNVFADARLLAPEVSVEAVIHANPAVIIMDTRQAVLRSRWQRFPMLSAVQHHAIFTIDPDLIDRASPRLVDGVAALCEALQRGRRAV